MLTKVGIGVTTAALAIGGQWVVKNVESVDLTRSGIEVTIRDPRPVVIYEAAQPSRCVVAGYTVHSGRPPVRL